MKITRFQIVVLLVFAAFIVAGVAAFATYKGDNESVDLPQVTIWGTFPKADLDTYVGKVNRTLVQRLNVMYVQKSSETFVRDFVSALARGEGPDAILIQADLLLPNLNKLLPIPYSVLSQRAFMNTYIDEASIYLGNDGIMGMPLVVDPLMMYWNRDSFNAAGLVLCAEPKCRTTWDRFDEFNAKLTVKNDDGTVTKSAIAMGDFANVANAREILGTLILQTGNPVTRQGRGGLESALRSSSTADPVSALRFFTQAVDPNSRSYSWNRSWPNSKTAFLSGNLATYFGLASELPDIQAKNPNLNFDIAPVPQAKSGGVAATYGRLYGFSIVKASRNANTAYQVISSLTSPAFLPQISSAKYLPSVSRAVIAQGSSDPYMSIFNEAALVSRTWLDTDPAISSEIMSSLVQAVTSGQKSAIQAMNDAGQAHDKALREAASQ